MILGDFVFLSSLIAASLRTGACPGGRVASVAPARAGSIPRGGNASRRKKKNLAPSPVPWRFFLVAASLAIKPDCEH
jgi:hypothetical protein